MKKYVKFTTVLLFLSFLIHTSCNNDDDVVVPPEDATTQDPDDTIDDDSTTDDTPVKTTDYHALKALYEANPDNTLGWDLDDTSMKSWDGVILVDERVSELRMNIKNVPKLVPEIGQLSELTRLYAQGNSIVEIPKEIGDLSQLLWLSIYNNSIAELPEEIGKLTNLEEFEITGNPLTVVPQEICELNFTIQKDLTMFCEGTIKDHNVLKILYNANTNNTLNWGDSIDDIKMTNWDGVTLSFTNERVTELELNNSGINDLVTEIGDLEQLQTLAIHSNSNIESLPKEIGQLANLEDLIIFECSLINGLPEEFWQLEKLQSLQFISTNLSQISDGVGNLQALNILMLIDSKFSTLPSTVGQLPLEKFYLQNNPLKYLPPEVCALSPFLDQKQIDDGICLELP